MKNINITATLKDAKEIHVFYLDAHRETITTLRELLDLMEWCDNHGCHLEAMPTKDGVFTNRDLFVCLNEREA